MYVRAPSGTKLEKTNDRIAEVERFVRKQVAPEDLKLIVSEIGVTPDWSAAYTPNAGKMDAVVRIQLSEEHSVGAYEYADKLRRAAAEEPRFADLEFAFNAGGLIRGALNEGKPTPINVRVAGKDAATSYQIADEIRRAVAKIDGVVDARIVQRLNYPSYLIDVDRAKAADLGLTQDEVMKNVIAAFNSSIQYNKNIFWVDEVSGNQYFVGVQYPLEEIESLESLLDVPITGVNQSRQNRRVAVREPSTVGEIAREVEGAVAPTVPLRNLVQLRRTSIPTEITDLNLQKTIDLNIGVHGRDLGHVVGRRLRRRREIRPAQAGRLGDDRPRHGLERLRPRRRRRAGPGGDRDYHDRRICPHERDVPRPGHRPGPGDRVDLLPDGLAGQVVRRAVEHPAGRAAGRSSASCRCCS